MKIVIDLMGADHGVLPIIEGVSRALENKSFSVVLVGDKDKATPFISKELASKVEMIHTQDYIKMDEAATEAIKRKESSIYLGMDILKNGADALISAGHSGATMGLATLRLGRIKGVERPAICTLMPSVGKRPSVLLDAGANTDCKPEYLIDFALMGYEYAKSVLHYDSPKVGLLSNGEEDIKGNTLVKETHKMLKTYDFFYGNVEGSDIFKGVVDVVVCDGFMGNVVLKTTEGVASAIGSIFKDEIKSSFKSKMGALMLKNAFGILKQKTDYAEYGGAPLLGVNKSVIISHGKSNARAVECAIYQAISAVESQVCLRITQAFESLKSQSFESQSDQQDA
ncbi:phosphate acyltransferase [Helicobacter pylori]|uniref:phosphate acyltransferase PlsX n=1 Tax=Helicobacter pylori TaxID=210 RepID=UPI000BEF04DE|nr:phosphate acyltransferase PlsX [Helicobacter pylori]OPG66842.1 phosphate acyltransferase [Helicobacter pylori]